MRAEFDAADQRALMLARDLTSHQLNWKPAPEIWSVGQCLDHLCVTSEVYLPAISDALSDRHTGVVQEIAPGWFARWFIRNYIEPSAATKRARAPRKVVPGVQIEAGILDRFIENNKTAHAVIERAAGYDVNRLRFENPFVPLLRFTVGAGFEILSRHQRRHLLQAERLTALPGFPAPAADSA